MTYKAIKIFLNEIAPKDRPAPVFETAKKEKEIDRKVTRITEKNYNPDIFYEERVVLL